MINETPVYSDKYLDLFSDHFVLKEYYFLSFGKKVIRYDEIEEFKEVRLTYFNGLTRHEVAWFKPRWPFDWKLKDRKEVIFVKSKGQFLGVGISSENIREVADLINKKLESKNVTVENKL